MYDLVIRGGKVVDGSGAAPFRSDVAVKDGLIAYVGPYAGEGREEIDANNLIVTPGFVDLHTHYDAQATWDPLLTPAAWHGVTSMIMGACGVGFAPARPQHRPLYAEIMENVEEIPAQVLKSGLPWTWETFPEYLDALDSKPRAVDIGAQIPFVALRAYVMGERSLRNEVATDDDIARMAKLVEDGLRAGAVGFSCSRTEAHRMSDGAIVPGALGDREELLRVADGVRHAGGGVIQCFSDLRSAGEEFCWLEELSVRSGAAVHFILIQGPLSDEPWPALVERLQHTRQGAKLVAHYPPRGIGSAMQFQSAIHPFVARPGWQAIKALPWPDKLAKLRDPSFRDRLLSERNASFGRADPEIADRLLNGYVRFYELGDDPDYEPDPNTASIAVRAAAAGVQPQAMAYDIMMKNDGTGMIWVPIVNYDEGNLDHVYNIFADDKAVVSLSDSGAHGTRVTDYANNTFMLTHWARDRKRGPTIPIEQAIKLITRDTAMAYNLRDRGLIHAGYLADLNVIDFEHLHLERPYMAYDLPAGGARLIQKAVGFVATIKRGQITFRNGEHTGALPGGVIRGKQHAPV